MPNHYRTLGVDPDADGAEIRHAYLALIRRHHPDKSGGAEDRARAQEVIAAYETLRDPERRAAYDGERRMTMAPAIGGTITAGARASSAARPRVRGGHAARNLFLVIAAGTAALGYWALQPPPGEPAQQVAAVAPVAKPEAEPALRPPRSAAELAAIAEADLPPPPAPPIDEAVEVELPPLPVARPAPMPVAAPVKSAERRSARPATTSLPARAAAAAAPAALPRDKAAAQKVDLVGLELHLRLLTDQSLRFADEGRKARLFATRDDFLGRLRSCRDDLCRRDTYLRRNQEVAEIMRR